MNCSAKSKFKCLIEFKNEYHILYINGNRTSHLLESIKKKKELYRLLSMDSKSYDFLIFDKDFDTWVHLDDDSQIDDLSRIRIRYRSTVIENNPFICLNANHNSICRSKTGDENSDESMVVSVNPNSMINHISKTKEDSPLQQSTLEILTNNLLNKNRTLIDNIVNTNELMNNGLMSSQNLLSSSLIASDMMNSNNLINSGLINNLEDESSNQSINQLSDDLMFEDKRLNENAVIEVEWSEDDLVILLESCRQYIQEFTYYNISVDLDHLDRNDDELWARIASRVQKFTSKSYNRQQCKTKFLKLRTTYINITAYSTTPESTYFGNLKYYNALKQLIDGLKPSIDLLQLNGQLKTRNKERCKERNKDKNVSSSYLALIQQVKAYSRQFAGEKNLSKATVWTEISNNLNSQGFTFTGKSAQGLFHRLRYTYLHLLKTITSEEEGRRWPYFTNFSDIDLTPFTSRRQESKRKPRKMKSENELNNIDHSN